MAGLTSMLDIGFKESKLKPNLKMAVERIKIATNRRSNAVKIAQREIAKLLEQEKDEKAAIRVEAVIRDDATIEAYGIIELICDLLYERSRLISAERACPEDLKPAVHTLIWAANRADVPELHEVKRQFVKKYGQDWVERAERNAENLVNERVLHKLSVRPPSAAVVVEYLQEIARKHEVKWTPTERFREQSERVWSAMAAPTGFSVPMAPGSGFSHLYNNAEGGGGGGPALAVATAIEGSMPVRPSAGIPPTDPYANKQNSVDFRPPSEPTHYCPTDSTGEALPHYSTGSGGSPVPPQQQAGDDGGSSFSIPVVPAMPYPSADASPSSATVSYDIPIAPSQTPRPPQPQFPLPPPSSGGPSAPGAMPDEDDLEARFRSLRGR